MCSNCSGQYENPDMTADRESSEEEVDLAIELGAEGEERLEREQIIEASRSVRAGTDMLFAALRKAGAL